MTTEQMALVKKLIQKHEIEATDAEWTLIFMGVGYGLSEQQIDSYLVMNTTDLLAKHEKMLCILLGMDSEMRQKECSLCWKIISKERTRRVVMKV